MRSIFSDEARAEIEPGLRRYELDKTIRHIRDTIGEADSYGFMTAFQKDGRLGFAYMGSAHPGVAAIYARRPNLGGRFEFSPAPICGEWRDDEFFVTHLKESAKLIGCTFAELTNYLAGRYTPWRFQGFWDGKPTDRGDNSGVWRPLWGGLVECAERAVASLPPGSARQIEKKLRDFAVSGQIVLDR